MPRGIGKDTGMDELLKKELNTSVLKAEGGGGGSISAGCTYSTDSGKVFVKFNQKSGARTMFDGETASLAKIDDMDIVRVPKPIKVIDIPGGGAALIMENLNMMSLSSHTATLGEQLARLHLKNKELAELEKKGEKCVQRGKTLQAVKEFGFETKTCCGFIPQGNAWEPTWEKFYAKKIQEQIDILPAQDISHVTELWGLVLRKLPKFFTGLDIFPALLHGDLWGGNAAQVDDRPVIFDAASFYGHSEYDLAIARMFGGFGRSFFDSYFKVIPKEKGETPTAVPAIPLHESLESFWWWIQEYSFKHIARPCQNAVGLIAEDPRCLKETSDAGVHVT